VSQAELEKYKETSSQALEQALELEKFPFFAGDIRDFDSAREEWLAHYKNERRNHPRNEMVTAQHSLFAERAALDALANIGYPNLEFDDLKRLGHIDDDEFEDELIVMAEVRAYFDVAHKVSTSVAKIFVR
jgi:RNase adaptor protein for sRNA GlmZ degradation